MGVWLAVITSNDQFHLHTSTAAAIVVQELLSATSVKGKDELAPVPSH